MGVLSLPLPDAKDEELLKIIFEADGHQNQWKVMQRIGHTNGWEVFLPYKEDIYQCKTADDFWQIVQQATKSWTRTFSDNKWSDIENYISKCSLQATIVESNGKRYKLKASGREFIIGKSSIDTVEIFLKGEKDPILIKTSDFTQVAVEIQ